MELKNTLEQREIRGLNFKQLAWLFGILFTGLGTIMYSYMSIGAKLDKMQDGSKLIEFNFELMKTDLKTVQFNQQQAEIRLTRLEEQVKAK